MMRISIDLNDSEALGKQFVSNKIAALIACHNRRKLTLACLSKLFENNLPTGTLLEIFLVDDGSVDGTSDAVQEAYPAVHILQGDGCLYWNGGMRMAFATAMAQDFDYYFWLNDDTFLYPDTIATLLSVENQIRSNNSSNVIVVGSTQSELGGRVNHGGVVKWKRISSDLVTPKDTPVPCETMYGNCVLIPREVAKVVGNLDAAFIHSIGDVDYGLRATKAGFGIYVMPGFAGTCSLNPVAGTIGDASLPLRLRFQKLLSPTGLPIKPFSIFLWRHFGVSGLIYGSWVYLKVFLTWLLARIKAV